MRDFNSFSNNESNNRNSDAMDTLNRLASKYEGASESDLMSAILKEAEKGRRNGTLTDSDIDNFVATVSPMLNSYQRAKLDSVVKKLKSK